MAETERRRDLMRALLLTALIIGMAVYAGMEPWTRLRSRYPEASPLLLRLLSLLPYWVALLLGLYAVRRWRRRKQG